MDPDPPGPFKPRARLPTESSITPLYGIQAADPVAKAAGKPRLRFAEEQRVAWPKPRSWHSRSTRSRKEKESGRDDKAGGAPGAYWSDDANDAQYTFYREPTPTPPEYDDDYGRLPYGGRAERGPAPVFEPPPRRPTRDRICGVRRRLFWILFIIVVILVVGIGVGAGVGVAVSRKSQANSHEAPPNATTSTSPSSTSPFSTPFPSSTTTSTPRPEATTSVLCQTTNNTIYNVPGSAKAFRRFCALDYSGVGGARDVTNVWTSTMEECMMSCSGLANCTGCGWGAVDGDDAGGKHRCWLKTELQTPHNASVEWSFAVLL